jgi:serine/threonine protein kinase
MVVPSDTVSELQTFRVLSTLTCIHKGAPELARDPQVSRSYDMWALGCIYLEFLLWYHGGDTWTTHKLGGGLNQASKPVTRNQQPDYHDSLGVLSSIQHLYCRLKERRMATDGITGPILHVIENSLLQVDPTRRLNAKQLQYQLAGSLLRLEAEQHGFPVTDSVVFLNQSAQEFLIGHATSDALSEPYSTPSLFFDSALSKKLTPAPTLMQKSAKRVKIAIIDTCIDEYALHHASRETQNNSQIYKVPCTRDPYVWPPVEGTKTPGSSFSSAIAAGIAALLLQYLREHHSKANQYLSNSFSNSHDPVVKTDSAGVVGLSLHTLLHRWGVFAQPQSSNKSSLILGKQHQPLWSGASTQPKSSYKPSLYLGKQHQFICSGASAQPEPSNEPSLIKIFRVDGSVDYARKSNGGKVPDLGYMWICNVDDDDERHAEHGVSEPKYGETISLC